MTSHEGARAARQLTSGAVDSLRSYLGGRQVVVSVSGGKDSTATALLMREWEIPYIAMHCDTGWETPDTDRYVREVLPEFIGEITIVRAPPVELVPEREAAAQRIEQMLGKDYSAMVRVCIEKGMFPGRVGKRWCTERLKHEPTKLFFDDLKDEPVNVVGVRAEESAKRAELDEWEWSDFYDSEVWRPLHHWLEQDVIDIHHRNKVPPNRHYTMGARRVGCMPCIFASKGEVRMMSEAWPSMVDALLELEKVVGEIAAERRGIEEWDPKAQGQAAPRWFQNPNYRREKRLGTHPNPGRPVPITEVIKWSQTDRKGEIEPFARPPHDVGCMRWGLCDMSWRKPLSTEEDSGKTGAERPMTESGK